MMRRSPSTALAVAFALALSLSGGPLAQAADVVAPTPAPGPARAIGSTAHGCLAGAVALPDVGPGWMVLRTTHNRSWGHPAMIAFLQRLASQTAPLGTLLIGDIAQPRGGPMASGHGSHQTGLDADILFRLATGSPSDHDGTDPDLTGVVREDGSLDPLRWGEPQRAVLHAFAADPAVERIFVNPAIKRSLCRTVTGDRSWLRTLRPWWGHAGHFHVRLRCPTGDQDCVEGAPVPAGDSCDATLDWWFTPEAAAPVPSTAPPVPLPVACRAILALPDQTAR